MRLYTFINMYLSSIQQGIQTAHIVSELFQKYEHLSHNLGNIMRWARNHKTIIVLNAGYTENIETLIRHFLSEENPYQWAAFNESSEALDGARTGVGIILPERVYEGAAIIREYGAGPIWSEKAYLPTTSKIIEESGNIVFDVSCFTPWELQFIDMLNQYSLAR